VRQHWDQYANNIKALKGRHIIRALGSINISPFQGFKNISTGPRRSRAGRKVCRPLRAKIQIHCQIINLLNSYFRLPPSAFRRSLFCFILMLAIVCCQRSALRAQTGAEFHNRRVTRVEINLNGAALGQEKLELLDIIQIAVGEPYSAVKVRAAILKLYKSNRAANVEVKATTVADGVQLLFVITRQLRVERVTFSGIPIFLNTDLRPRLTGLSSGDKLTEPNVNRSAENLVRFYHDAGYFQVAITPTIQPDADGARAAIDFAIMPGAQAQIGKFQFDGETKIAGNIIESLKCRPDAPFTQANLEADLETLRKRHIAENYLDPHIGTPQISYDGEKNIVNISVAIDSGPKVMLSVEGIDFKPEKLREALPMLQQGGIDDFNLEEGRRQLLELAQREGYFFANIIVEREEGDPIKIVYKVDRGQRYRIADIRLKGVDAFSIEDIADSLSSRKASLVSRGITSDEFLDHDGETIAAKLRDLGYAKVSAVQHHLDRAPNDQDIVIIFTVEQGERVIVAETDFDGNRVFSAGELLARLPARKISYYSQSRVNSDIDALLALYSKQGYAEARISADVENIDDARARVTFRIEEGEQILINRVVIKNRGRASEASIRKYLTFQEGDLLQREELNKSEQQLYGIGAFRIVRIHSELIGRNIDGKALHDVFVETVESQHYTLTYGFGNQDSRIHK
jgi:outer membrane protein assembly factor BamA